MVVAEAKYIIESALSEAQKKSQKQLRDTVARIEDALFGNPRRLDRDLWLARISDMLLEGIDMNSVSSLALSDEHAEKEPEAALLPAQIIEESRGRQKFPVAEAPESEPATASESVQQRIEVQADDSSLSNGVGEWLARNSVRSNDDALALGKLTLEIGQLSEVVTTVAEGAVVERRAAT